MYIHMHTQYVQLYSNLTRNYVFIFISQMYKIKALWAFRSYS